MHIKWVSVPYVRKHLFMTVSFLKIEKCNKQRKMLNNIKTL